MKYISLQDLIDHGNELRFQSAEQMAKVYEQLPSTEIIRCKNCKWWERKYPGSSYGYCHACKHNSYSGHWEIHITRTYNEDFFCAEAINEIQMSYDISEDAKDMSIEALSSNIVGRCKDCDNWNDGITTYDCYWDKEYHYENPGPDDYCSRWTERKKQ